MYLVIVLIERPLVAEMTYYTFKEQVGVMASSIFLNHAYRLRLQTSETSTFCLGVKHLALLTTHGTQ